MKVLVIGTGGALARQVALRLHEAKHTVIGMDWRPWPDAPSEMRVHQVDIRKRAKRAVKAMDDWIVEGRQPRKTMPAASDGGVSVEGSAAAPRHSTGNIP